MKKEIAHNAVQFLERVNIQAKEIPAYLEVHKTLSLIADPSLAQTPEEQIIAATVDGDPVASLDRLVSAV
jgi:hypothetical protein